MGAIADATKGLKSSKTKPRTSTSKKTAKKKKTSDLLEKAANVLQEEIKKKDKLRAAKKVREDSIQTLPVNAYDPRLKVEESVNEILSKVDLDITKQEREVMVQTMCEKDINIDSIVRICDGVNCPHFWCPFKSIKKYPLTKLCPVEREIAKSVTNEYFVSLGLDSVQARIVAADQILTLAECHLNELRNRGILQKQGMTQMNAAFAIKSTGEVVYNEEISVIFDLKERIAKRKDTILKQLVAYPEIRARLKLPNRKKDESDGRALLNKAETLLKEIEKK